MKSSIVGIGGQFGQGKDELANHVAASLNFAAVFPKVQLGATIWKRDAFAHGVKKVFCDTFGVDIDFVEKWKRVDEPPPGFLKTMRQMLIDIGDGFRAFRQDVWINRALGTESGFSKVISDARYINELEVIKSRNGITILMWRPGHENSNPNASEQQLMAYVRRFQTQYGKTAITNDPLIDIFFVNDGDVPHLKKQADEIVLPYITQMHAGSENLVISAV